MKQVFAALVSVAVAVDCYAYLPDQILIWPSVPPGSEHFTKEARREARPRKPYSNTWLADVSRPRLFVHQIKKPTKQPAIVIFPGGGYAGQATDKEGHYVAEWLKGFGLVGVVAEYRCGGAPHQHPIPLDDAQRAVQLVRSRASDYGIDPNAIGVMGFSAGGHLAATAATQWLEADPESSDPVRHVSSRPDFAILVYPVISMRDGVTHEGSRRNLLGDNPTKQQIATLSADEQVTSKTPPTLLIHSSDDQTVPIENSLRYYKACLEKGVRTAAHFYPSGGHGYGMWRDQGSVAEWPSVLSAWLIEKEWTLKK